MMINPRLDLLAMAAFFINNLFRKAEYLQYLFNIFK